LGGALGLGEALGFGELASGETLGSAAGPFPRAPRSEALSVETLLAGTPGAALAPGAPTAEIGMTAPHFRHFIFRLRPATFASSIWYLALQF
jgi:hypothetical protein